MLPLCLKLKLIRWILSTCDLVSSLGQEELNTFSTFVSLMLEIWTLADKC